MSFAAIFDMDGVLVDNGAFHKKAWQQFCSGHRIVFSEKRFREVFFGRTNVQVLPELFGSNLSSAEIQKLGNEKEKIYREIFRSHLKPTQGLVRFLDELKSREIPVAVATSAPTENVEFVLNGLQIQKYFNVVVDDSMVTHGKPHPEIYLKAAELLNIEPAKCVVFEDSLPGTKSAFDAGTKVIALTTTLPADKHRFAHHIISDFSEISVNFISQNIFN